MLDLILRGFVLEKMAATITSLRVKSVCREAELGDEEVSGTGEFLCL